MIIIIIIIAIIIVIIMIIIIIIILFVIQPLLSRKLGPLAFPHMHAGYLASKSIITINYGITIIIIIS